MTIELVCPACGRQIAAKDTAAGRRARCPGCGQVVDVPGQGEGAAMAETAPGADARVAALEKASPPPQAAVGVTPSRTRGSATTVARIAARRSPYRSLRVTATMVFVFGVVLGTLVFLAGLAGLLLLAMQEAPIEGVFAFVGGLMMALVLIIGAKALAELLRLAADTGDRLRQVLLHLEEQQMH